MGSSVGVLVSDRLDGDPVKTRRKDDCTYELERPVTVIDRLYVSIGRTERTLAAPFRGMVVHCRGIELRLGPAGNFASSDGLATATYSQNELGEKKVWFLVFSKSAKTLV